MRGVPLRDAPVPAHSMEAIALEGSELRAQLRVRPRLVALSDGTPGAFPAVSPGRTAQVRVGQVRFG